MRHIITFSLFACLAASAHADFTSGGTSGGAGNSMNSVLLARLGGTLASSTTLNAKNVLDAGASASMQPDNIYYSTLTLTLPSPTSQVPPTLDTTTPGSTNDLGDLTKPGDNGVLTGGGASGSGSTGGDGAGGSPHTLAVPTPGAAGLGLLGLASLPRRRRKR